MEEKGKKVNYFWVSPKQLYDFKKILNEEEDMEKKKSYQLIFWGQITLFPIYIIGMLFLISITT